MKKCIFIIATLVLASNAMADLVVRNTTTNTDVEINKLITYSTSDHPNMLLSSSGDAVSLEFSQKSLVTNGISKKDLLDFWSDPRFIGHG